MGSRQFLSLCHQTPVDPLQRPLRETAATILGCECTFLASILESHPQYIALKNLRGPNYPLPSRNNRKLRSQHPLSDQDIFEEYAVAMSASLQTFESISRCVP